MRALIGTALLALALTTSAAPQHAPTTKPQACECTVNMPPAAPDARGTDQSPVVVAVKPPADEAAEKDWEHKKGETDTTTNENIAQFTSQLVLATIVLGIVGLGQATLIAGQIWLNRQEFVSTNRPRLSLREAYTAEPKTKEDYAKPISVNYKLVNLGGTRAFITRSKYCIELLPMEGEKRQLELEEPSNTDGQKELQGGAELDGLFKAAPPVKWESASFDIKGRVSVTRGGDSWGIFFYGRVAYRDDRNIERFMAFYRVLQHGSFRFVPIDDKQLEYSDTNP